VGSLPQVQLGVPSDGDSGRSNLEPLLKVDHLMVSFSRQRGLFRNTSAVVKAVDDVSLEIYESEIISLVGESGSGKSTVARCITGLNEVSSGSIIHKGLDISKLKGNAIIDYRKEVQMIFQDPFESLNPRQDIYTSLSIPLRRLRGLRTQDEIADAAAQLLKEVGLFPDETMFKLPHQLSGGERQRVNIARALAPNPKLLIADEPITMLDASQRLNILSLLMSLKVKRNLTILIITHDLASARSMSDRTAVMYLGKLVEIGPTEVILSKPNHPYTELILQATPKLKEDEVGMESVEESEDETPLSAFRTERDLSQGCVYMPRCKYATDICKQSHPELKERGATHYAACYNPLN
jgi:peptide/nickel transport system ATP-binding protein